jgi:ABC-type nickel/cobalt efflux system permease component RcnA
MGALYFVTVIGFVLGMRHATDPDHVIAVTTIVARKRSLKQAMLVGAFWGLGHTLTILAVGGAIILFGVVVPPRIGLAMELCVGLMLILLGALNLTGVTRWVTERFTPSHTHEHIHTHSDEAGHTHTHTHRHRHGALESHHGAAASDEEEPTGWLDRKLGSLGVYHSVRPLLVGIVHGLAGSAAVALLVLAAIPKPIWGVVYLLIFGAGTIAGMVLITAAIALPYVHACTRFARLNTGLTVGSGLLSLGFGLFIFYQVGFVEGLFTSHPNWIPH